MRTMGWKAGLAVMALVGAGAARADEPTADPWQDPEFQKRFLGSYGVFGELEPRVSPPERAQLEAIIPLMSNEREKALEQLAAIIKPESSAVLDFTLGNLLFQLDRLEEASASYRTAIEKFPSFLRAHKNLGLVSVRRGDMTGAITAFTRMVELGGGDGFTYGLLGHAYAARQDYLPAESAYRQAALLQPEQVDWKLGLARCLFKQEKYAEAASLCAELIGKHPDRAEFWQLQASAFIGLKEPLRAAQNYELLARMGKANALNLYTLGDIYVNESLWDMGARAYGQALELDQGKGFERTLRAAEALAQRGATQQARTLLAAVEEAGGREIDAADRKKMLKLEARLAVSEGRGGEAAAVLEQIVSIDPLDAEALMLLGQHYAGADEPEKAIFFFERARSIDGFEAEAGVRQAQVLVKLSRYGEAIPLLKRSLELNPREEVARFLEQVERVARSRSVTPSTSPRSTPSRTPARASD